MNLRARAVGLLATTLTLAIVLGLPALLLTLGANPVPDSLPTLTQIRDALTRPDDGTIALSAISILAWIAWLVMTATITVELGARLRGIRPPTLPGLRLPQHAAHELIAAAALLFLTLPATTTHALAGPASTAAAPHTAATTTTPAATSTTEDLVTTSPSENTNARAVTVRAGDTLYRIAERELGDGTRWPELAAANPAVAAHPDLIHPRTVLTIPEKTSHADLSQGAHIVQAGDTLSAIAARHLGDPDRWPEIYHASRATRQPDGRYITDPDQIDIGQRLTIPGHTTPSPPLAPSSNGHHRPPELVTEQAEAQGGAKAPTHNPDTRATLRDHRPRVGTHAPTPAATSPTPDRATVATQDTARYEHPTRALPSAASTRVRDHDTGEPVSEHMTQAPWMLAGLTGAGALLTGALLLLLRRRRQAQSRNRLPGHTLEDIPPELAPVEKTIQTIGQISGPTVEHLDRCLRDLARAMTAQDAPMPELGAVELTTTGITLHLSAPADLPPPWTGSDDALHWDLHSPDPPPDEKANDVDDADQPAPYPLLTTIGVTDTEHIWLLNLEDQILALTGDPTYAQDYLRYLALDVLCQPWATDARIHSIHTGPQPAGLATQPGTITTAAAGDDVEELIGGVQRAAESTLDRTSDTATGTATARAQQLGADTWPAHLLLVDTTAGGADNPEASAPWNPHVEELLDLVTEHPTRSGTGIAIHTDPTSDNATLTLEFTADGMATLQPVGLHIVPVGLTPDEAEGCALILAQAASAETAPVPSEPHPREGTWQTFANQAGALRTEHTQPRHQASHSPTSEAPGRDGDHPDQATQPPAGDHPRGKHTGRAEASSILPLADDTYTTIAATTADDLATLAPTVNNALRAQVEQADPTLDADLAMWFHPDCALPRLHLLGPVHAVTRGKPLTLRKPYMTEMLTYIATRSQGITVEELAETFNITTNKARVYAAGIREWLGTNPRTGQPHLPDARLAPAAATRGVPLYQVVDILIDTDLFRRLRTRAEARGPDGIDDLITALSLVEGRPYDYPLEREAAGGWAWLVDGDRSDQHMAVAIVDVAHIVTTHALATSDLTTARTAAETAALAAPHEEIPRLDLAAVAHAAGHHAEASRIIRDDICNRTDDDQPPTEINARTAAILEQHRLWKHAG
ncbi:MAG: LysM peptidoglycan-binding domain-containing protein [Acidimicrobiales bacterium]|nr:LysM peptidoglycan-binding domain-containing protein [Acidimicrobiales bacterium]